MRISNKHIKTIIISALTASTLSGCATTSSKVVETPTVASYNTTYSGTKSKLVVGQFVNRSSFQNGIFSSGISISSAPAPIPAFKAICPASRPITSTMKSRLWELAVSLILSIASITVFKAVS